MKAPPKKMHKSELVEKFRLAAAINGIAWDDLVDTQISHWQCFFGGHDPYPNKKNEPTCEIVYDKKH